MRPASGVRRPSARAFAACLAVLLLIEAVPAALPAAGRNLDDAALRMCGPDVPVGKTAQDHGAALLLRAAQLAAALLLLRRVFRLPLSEIGIDVRTWRTEAPYTLPLAAAGFASAFLLARLLPSLGGPPLLPPGTPLRHWEVVLAARVAVGPFVEELAFRGLLQGALRPLAGPLPSVALSALLFGAAHLPDGPAAAAWTLAGGLVFGAIYEITGSLLTPFLLHAAWNGAIVAAGI